MKEEKTQSDKGEVFMKGTRVHELAKELNMNNKDFLDRILKMGVLVKNHMSFLTDSAVQKIRQQFAEAKAEKVEEKRIGRAVIRRRKQADEEGVPAGDAPVGEAVAGSESLAGEVFDGEEMVEAEPVFAVEAEPSLPPEDLRDESPVEAVASEEISDGSPVDASPVAEQIEVVEEPPVSEVVVSRTEPVPPRPDREEVVAVEPESPVAPVSSVPEEDAPPVEIPLPATSVAPVVDSVAVPPVSDENAASADGAETEEDDEEAKKKKAKKRRRKKTHKDEPARIIKLPEIIIEEEPIVEEETVIPQHIATKLQPPAEDAEAKERKKRRAEEEKEAADRKRRGVGGGGGGRREVVSRENLYSKKELAAQADRGRGKGRGRGAPYIEPPKPEPVVAKPGKRRVKIDEAITVANLAKQMGVKATEVIKKLLLLGLPASINQAVDFDTASLMATEFDFEVDKVGFEEDEILQVQEDRPDDLKFRPPVITVMGHVDHGKTSLLDAIRQTNVIGGEAGGITQHIGAYYVRLKNGDVVFLDTPGHEAFTSMRARGAKVTDIVILMVAADDGVMQQTVEAINHAKAAQVPIIVAINKIDKPNANIEKVKRELSEHALIPEEWGGTTTMVEISAKKRIGIEELLEMVLLQAELLDLRANPTKPARGRVIEAKLDKGRGPVATILIQEGTLKAGDYYLCGSLSGRVRNMFSDRGRKLDEAGPSRPVEVLGLPGVPNAGDDFIVLTDEKQAKLVAERRHSKLREKELTKTSKITLESLFEQIQDGEIKELNLILKTDVHGSQEAIADSLLKLSTPEVKINLMHNATGAITESDVMLASASNAIVIGFSVRADGKVTELAEQEHVDIRYYDVIYQLLSDIKDAMVGMLDPTYKEIVMGRVDVRQTFHVPKIGTIAGGYVLDGRIERNAKVRVIRDGVVINEGKVTSLRRFKDDAKEVKAGFECGVGIENFNDIKVGDILEAFELQEVKATLEFAGDNVDRRGRPVPPPVPEQ